MFELGDHDALPPGWEQRLIDVLVEDDVAAVDAPWIVAHIDPTSGATVYSGPYLSGVHALEAVEWEQASQAKTPAAERFRFELVRLSPPTCPPETGITGSGSTNR